jgi:hypothetical protein
MNTNTNRRASRSPPKIKVPNQPLKFVELSPRKNNNNKDVKVKTELISPDKPGPGGRKKGMLPGFMNAFDSSGGGVIRASQSVNANGTGRLGGRGKVKTEVEEQEVADLITPRRRTGLRSQAAAAKTKMKMKTDPFSPAPVHPPTPPTSKSKSRSVGSKTRQAGPRGQTKRSDGEDGVDEHLPTLFDPNRNPFQDYGDDDDDDDGGGGGGGIDIDVDVDMDAEPPSPSPRKRSSPRLRKKTRDVQVDDSDDDDGGVGVEMASVSLSPAKVRSKGKGKDKGGSGQGKTRARPIPSESDDDDDDDDQEDVEMGGSQTASQMMAALEGGEGEGKVEDAQEEVQPENQAEQQVEVDEDDVVDDVREVVWKVEVIHIFFLLFLSGRHISDPALALQDIINLHSPSNIHQPRSLSNANLPISDPTISPQPRHPFNKGV